MVHLVQSLVDGLMQGSVLSLAAVGFSLIFGVMGVVNLSHGIMVILGAYIALLAKQFLGLDALVALPFVAVLCFLASYGYDRIIVHPAIRRSNLLSSLLVTYGAALVIQNVFSLAFSPDFQSLRPAYANAHFRLGGVVFNSLDLISLAASLILIALLALVLNRLPIGRVIKATAEQSLAARLCGVDIDRIYAITFGLAGAFAGAAGVLIGMLYPFSPASQEQWTIYGFAVVVLGGIGSASGALFGGLLLGIISTLTTQFIGAAYPNAMAFLVLVLMLVVRPNGILGNAFSGSR
jgi:branched-chain amino acid transport system permease protein